MLIKGMLSESNGPFQIADYFPVLRTSHFIQDKWVEKGTSSKGHQTSWWWHTLNSLGTSSFGVSTPTRASIPQKIKMDKIMAKSLMSFRAWNRSWYHISSQRYETPFHLCFSSYVILQACVWWQYKLIVSPFTEIKVCIVMPGAICLNVPWYFLVLSESQTIKPKWKYKNKPKEKENCFCKKLPHESFKAVSPMLRLTAANNCWYGDLVPLRQCLKTLFRTSFQY